MIRARDGNVNWRAAGWRAAGFMPAERATSPHTAGMKLAARCTKRDSRQIWNGTFLKCQHLKLRINQSPAATVNNRV
jgi:hypothetical protein